MSKMSLRMHSFTNFLPVLNLLISLCSGGCRTDQNGNTFCSGQNNGFNNGRNNGFSNGNVNFFGNNGGTFISNNFNNDVSTNCVNNVCSVCNSYACKVISTNGGSLSISCTNNQPCQYCSGRGQCQTVDLPNGSRKGGRNRNNYMKQHHLRGCEPAYCPADCSGYVLVTQSKRGKDCPICKCDNYGVTKPCSQGGDCDSGNCEESRGLCRYPEPKGQILKECAFDSNCPRDQECDGGFCLAGKGRKPPHLEGVQCVFEYECPSEMYCSDMTCYEQGGPNSRSNRPPHLEGVQCVFIRDCPADMFCRDMTCYEGGGSKSNSKGTTQRGAQSVQQGRNRGRGSNSGQGNTIVRHLPGVQCTFEHDCPADMHCNQQDMTCYEKTGRRHEPGRSCVFSYQCSNGFTCDDDQMTCFEGGRDEDHEGGQCVFDRQCSQGYRCMDRSMTCVRG